MTSGIYAIVGPGPTLYLGSSKNCAQRWRAHRRDLNAGVHKNAHLQHAWRKHGPDSFRFLVVEPCAPVDTLAREQVWLDQARAGGARLYNIATRADRPAEYDRTTPEYLARWGAWSREQWADPGYRERQNKALRAALNTPETLARKSASACAAHARPETKERHKAACAAANTKPELRRLRSEAMTKVWAARRAAKGP